MSQNPLDRFRKVGTEPAGAEEYEAFYPVDGAMYLKIRRRGAPTQRPYYQGLVDVIDDEPFGTNAVLVYSFGMVVMLTGRNLCELVEAIARHQVEWIQQYDADRWGMPQDKAKPVIETIEIIVKEPVDGLADGERKGRKVKN